MEKEFVNNIVEDVNNVLATDPVFRQVLAYILPIRVSVETTHTLIENALRNALECDYDIHKIDTRADYYHTTTDALLVVIDPSSDGGFIITLFPITLPDYLDLVPEEWLGGSSDL